MDITSNDYIFKKVEELKKGDKYILNDKIHTVNDIRHLRMTGTRHHPQAYIIFTLQCDEDNTITKKWFELGYGKHGRMVDGKLFWYIPL
jgi:hypothetical protein